MSTGRDRQGEINIYYLESVVNVGQDNYVGQNMPLYITATDRGVEKETEVSFLNKSVKQR